MWGLSDLGASIYLLYIQTPPICLHALICLNAPNTYMPPCPCTSVCFQGTSTYDMEIGGICSPHMSWGYQHICLTFWCLSVYPLPLSSQQSCPLLPITVGCFLTGLDAYGCLLSFMVLSLSLFYYVLSLYYYSSSSDYGVFWYVICFIGYHGHLLDGASSNIRSACCGSAATADTKALWRCCWPVHCATATSSISDASSGLCQLCHGSSTGRFLFQS